LSGLNVLTVLPESVETIASRELSAADTSMASNFPSGDKANQPVGASSEKHWGVPPASATFMIF
jgi:hypothetical protein